MTFKPGQSGNPSGRPPGIVDRRNRIAKAFDNEFDAVGAAIVAKAKEGDVAAAALYLSRVEPPLRPRAERIQVELDPSAPLAAQGQQVLAAAAAGDIDPDTARMLIDCLHSIAALRNVDELEERLAALEEQVQAGAGTSHPGGVMFFEDEAK